MESQHDVRRRNEQLIGDRIQIGTQRSFLIQAAREQTIQSIGETGDYKNHHGPSVSFVMNSDDKDWQKGQAQERELVGNREYSAVHEVVRLRKENTCVQANCSKKFASERAVFF